MISYLALPKDRQHHMNIYVEIQTNFLYDEKSDSNTMSETTCEIVIFLHGESKV